MSKIQIVAEIGNTHEGSIGLAKQFIKVAAECGVDAVKFQTHIFSAESLPNAPMPPYFKAESRQSYFERTAFSLEQYIELKNFAEKECNVEFFSSPFSLEAVDFLEEVGVKTYKVPSGEISNIPFLIKLAKTGKKIILSSGMSNWDEMDLAVATLKENRCGSLVVLQCTSEYPCPPEETGLHIMAEMRERYGCDVGFSDHTLGNAIPIAAAVLGAVCIEKHFTLSKLMFGSDAKNSTEPAEFKQLVEDIRKVESALTSTINKDEKAGKLQNMKEIFEKSIVTSNAIEKGQVIELEDLAFKKPGTGIPTKHYMEIVGKTATRNIPKDTQIEWAFLS